MKIVYRKTKQINFTFFMIILINSDGGQLVMAKELKTSHSYCLEENYQQVRGELPAIMDQAGIRSTKKSSHRVLALIILICYL